eukprot:4802010-Amphidinium_carterae.1
MVLCAFAHAGFHVLGWFAKLANISLQTSPERKNILQIARSANIPALEEMKSRRGERHSLDQMSSTFLLFIKN